MSEPGITCNIPEETVAAYIYDELAPEERAAYEAHLASCEHCRRMVEETRRLQELLNQRTAPEPTPELIVRCRQSLDEALDREQLGWRSLIRSFLPFGLAGRLAGSGVVGALVLALFGFGLGWRLRGHGAEALHPGTTEPLAPISASDLTNLKVRNISQVTPDPKTGDVRITVNAERRVTMEGSLDDPHIRELLVSAVKGYENAGIRRDALDALRGKSDHPAVREALIYAMRNDPNSGDRLDALKAVQAMEWGDDMHQALLDAAQHDKNPGVRFAAIDTLADRAVRQKDRSLIPTLQLLATQDPNRYARVKCAEAIHELAAEEQ